MKTPWPNEPLGGICSFRHGGTPSKADDTNWNGTFPWVSSKDMRADTIMDTADHLSDEAVRTGRAVVARSGSILVVVRSGILAHTLPLAIAGRDVAFNQDLKALTVTSPDVQPEYIYRFLQSKSPEILLRGTKRGATVQSIQSGFLESLAVPIPPLPEQRRIVAILDEADHLRKLRREADRRTADLIPALFHDMFGDPATNPKRWPICEVREFVAGLEGGKSLISQEDDGEGNPYRVLKVSAVTSAEYRPDESKPVAGDYVPPESHIVRRGDLLFSRANTTELVGATAYVFATPPKRILPDKLWRFVWREPLRPEPLWVWGLFRQQAVRDELGKRASGTSGSMKNISKPKVLSMRVPVPPLPLQRQFAAAVADIRATQDQQQASRRRLDDLYQSLLHRAFRGEL